MGWAYLLLLLVGGISGVGWRAPHSSLRLAYDTSCVGLHSDCGDQRSILALDAGRSEGNDALAI